ncbi:ATP-dependent helicase HrpB [Olivibacter sp. XZL3]|uniref:ATP-dependent helicase HrpB n=1 Tax=Olivibacter sp. XZL3 TaxID=1735116 RepID=UPI00198135F1|nr:ATP-dependent helicase HrpB [Olivibacter sp. XZL3]
MSMIFEGTQLPITQIVPQVREHLANQSNLIVSASPGAGKSTYLPLSLLNEPWLHGKKILLLEPRRLAATSIAGRMAAQLKEAVGRTIGYRVRFERKVSQATRIEVVTEGILTRMIQEDNALEAFGLIIFDEFHERSIHADTALTLCLESQQVLRPDLRLLVMSATLDVPNLAQLLQCPTVECPSKTFPVDIVYTGEQVVEKLPYLCVQTILRALKETTGDILVFLPGQAIIHQCKELLQAKKTAAAVHCLYGQLPLAAQQAALLPDAKGARKVILATSIAETSLTIEGVRVVIDSGFTREAKFDPRTSLSSLQTVAISLDSATQRSGRAGRLGPGVCYRMWSKLQETKMKPYRHPEITETDLMPLALELLKWGVSAVNQLTWLTPPPLERFTQAQNTLARMGALKEGKITAHGRALHRLPCHPRLAHMLSQAAAEKTYLHLATDIAALLEERDPLSDKAEADFNLRIEELRRTRKNHLRTGPFVKVIRAATYYRDLFDIEENNDSPDPYITGRFLAHAYPDRIAGNTVQGSNRFIMANGRKAALDPHDSLCNELFLAIAQLDIRAGEGRIFLAAPLQKEDILPWTTQLQSLVWDGSKGGLHGQEEWKIDSLIVQSKPLREIPEALATEVLLQAIKREGLDLLNFHAEVEQWQNRVLSLRHWNPEEGWPAVDTTSLLESADKWLTPYLYTCRKTEDLRKLDLYRILSHSLPVWQQRRLDELAPIKLTVPSGSQIKLQYAPNGEPPVLAVRLQEVFGMLKTPFINEGKTPLVLHLLSPGFKPVQITSDLKSFWNSTYFEVRKELKRRYPKHAWPENPYDAPAVRGAINRRAH